MKMKNKNMITPVILILLTTLVLTSCGSTVSNGLLEDASPGTSALEFFYFDGETVTSSFLFEQELVEEVLAKLDAVPVTPAPNWSLEDITLPLYGFWIGGVSGWGVYGTWSNGYWITSEGNAYTFDFDFEILRSYPWDQERTFHSFAMFPNARILTQDDDIWNSLLLTPVDIEDEPMNNEDELAPPSGGEGSEAPTEIEPIVFWDTTGITMTLVDWNRERVIVNITNENNEEWMYGEHFSLHVLLDGRWYDVPPLPDWAFTDIGLIVPPGGEVEHIYHLAMFGDLPSGTYRIAAYGLYVEFDLP